MSGPGEGGCDCISAVEPVSKDAAPISKADLSESLRLCLQGHPDLGVEL